MNVSLDALFRIDGKVAVVADSGACASPDVAPVLESVRAEAEELRLALLG